MKYFGRILILPVLLLAATGCDTGQSPVGVDPLEAQLAGTQIPSSEAVQSATLNLYVVSPSFQTVNAHRVTDPWSEADVTWNSFGSGFAPEVQGSFAGVVPGWKTVDLTALVKGWVDSSYANYGLLLDQEIITYPRGVFFSSENVMSQPYLEVCYSTDAGDTCEIFPVMADAVLDGNSPDAAAGSGTVLLTGYSAVGLEYQSLMQFDLPVVASLPPDDSTIIGDTTIVDDSTVVIDSTTIIEIGCTQPRSWWMRRTGCDRWSKEDRITDLLPIWLGTPGGERSVEVTDNCQASGLLRTWRMSNWSNPLRKLYTELLAAKLNIGAGADNAAIAAVIDTADAYIANQATSHRRWSRRCDSRQVHEWVKMLHQYNVGEIGPGRCDETLPAITE